MGVYTKTGDHGETGLYTGERVRKSSLRVEAYGAVDELDSALAMGRAFCRKEEVCRKIFALQKMLPLLMADLASMGQKPMIGAEYASNLEHEMDEMEAALPPLKSFLIPGDTQGGAALDLARTVARRAERCFCRLSEQEETHEEDRVLLNRISDYCFLLMRMEEQEN
ncbi:MAG: cob(I)yrinic acid a,c-diamide adenosyltransferase [Selenomonadaceae bacterium]|nr:cob(I)yrinic acid a,c-diamide adenosyltransferase [Selenomonadaceae bacterium]